jgi:multidrug transporter EmrE-like cation transporter
MIQTIILLACSILTTVFAQLLLKKGMSLLGSLNFSWNNFFGLISQIFHNIWLASGLLLFGVSFLFWLFVISRVKLSMVYPISTSLNFILITFFSWLFLREQLSLAQFFGIMVIIAGIFILAKS